MLEVLVLLKPDGTILELNRKSAPWRDPDPTRAVGQKLWDSPTMKAYPEQIRPFVPMPYHVLGTDGYGRSDTREKLRHFFEVDRHWITVKALQALAEEGQMPTTKVAEAVAKYGLDAAKPNPVQV